MEGLYNDAVTLQVVVGNAFYREDDPPALNSGARARPATPDPPAADAPAAPAARGAG